MPEYLAPGVYVEEIHTGPRPIEGVSTSTAGFVGETERGPTRPTLVTSWPDYQRMVRWLRRPAAIHTRTIIICRTPFAASSTTAASGCSSRGCRSARPRPLGELRRDARVHDHPSASGPGEWGNQHPDRGEAGLGRAIARTGSAEPARPVVPHPGPLLPRRRAGSLRRSDGSDELANPNRHEPDAFEDFDNLSHDPTRPNFAMTVINGASQLIEVVSAPGPPTVGGVPRAISLDNRHDTWRGTRRLSRRRNGRSRRPNGPRGLLTIRDISLMALPDEVVDPNLSRPTPRSLRGDEGSVRDPQRARTERRHCPSHRPAARQLPTAPSTTRGCACSRRTRPTGLS